LFIASLVAYAFCGALNFRGLTIPTKTPKIGIQANKNEFSVIFEYNVIKLNTLIGHTISDLELI